MQGSVATRRRVQVTGRRVTGVKLRECVASCDAGIPVARTCPAGSATHVDPTRHCPNGTDMLHPGLRRGCMTPDDRWLATVWPFVRRQLPSAPARVLEVGCGPLGGFVPAPLEDGYKAVGVDPEAPEGSDYQQEHERRHRYGDQRPPLVLHANFPSAFGLVRPRTIFRSPSPSPPCGLPGVEAVQAHGTAQPGRGPALAAAQEPGERAELAAGA